MALVKVDHPVNAPVAAMSSGTLAIALGKTTPSFLRSHRVGQSRLSALGEVTSSCLLPFSKQRSCIRSLPLSGRMFAGVSRITSQDKMEHSLLESIIIGAIDGMARNVVMRAWYCGF